MFTGFATENTPAIKVWDFFSSAAASFSRIGLTDDCAPIQYFRTGGTTSSILLYLPTCPIEGKSIRIINAQAGSSAQQIAIAASDTNNNGSYTTLHTLAQGDSIELIYSKDWITTQGFAANIFGIYSGWLAINRMPFSAGNSYAAVLSGNNNRASNYVSVVGGGNGNTASGQYSKVGGGNGNTASNYYGTVGGGNSNNSSAQYATIGGGSSCTASANFSTIGGGSSNSASGSTSVVAGGGGNVASNSYAAITGGQNNNAQAPNSFIGGGYVNYVTTSSNYGAVCGGYGNYSTGDAGTAVLGGNNNYASGTAAAIIAGSYCTTRGLAGYVVLTGGNNPLVTTYGASQAGVLLLAAATTDATPTLMRSDSNAAGNANQLILNNNSALYFAGECVATVTTSSGNTKGWSFAGVAKKGASAAATAFVGTPTVTSSYADAGAAAYTLALTVDTTNGGVAFTVTGAAATNIRWVCRIRVTEVAFT